MSEEDDFKKIIDAYGIVMKTSLPAPGTVADVTKLPYPKQQIKDALIAGARSTDDSQNKEIVKYAYVELANWQENVGDSNIGFDLSNIDPNQDAKSLAKQVLEESEGTKYWMDKVKKEQEVLKQEWDGINP